MWGRDNLKPHNEELTIEYWLEVEGYDENDLPIRLFEINLM
jgi:hypothetical protein